MRAMRAAGWASLAAGALLLAYAAASGDVRVGLLLIVPFVYGTGLAPFLGMLLAMAGIVMLMTSAFAGAAPRAEGGHVERRSSGVVLLGPIPIVWGDRKLWPWAIGAAAVLLALTLLTWGRR